MPPSGRPRSARRTPMSDDGPSDPSSSWLSDLRAGRPTGWRRLVETFEPVVRHWCRHAGLQPADADDVTQEAFAKVRRGIGDFQPGNFVGWLYRITANAVRDHH